MQFAYWWSARIWYHSLESSDPGQLPYNTKLLGLAPNMELMLIHSSNVTGRIKDHSSFVHQWVVKDAVVNYRLLILAFPNTNG